MRRRLARDELERTARRAVPADDDRATFDVAVGAGVAGSRGALRERGLWS
jgi:hypothetical protein